MLLKNILCLAAFLFLLIQTVTAQSKWSYPGCADVTDADFIQEVLIGTNPVLSPKLVDPTLLEPIELGLAPDGQGGADIYFVERRGKVKFYDQSANTVTVAGTINVDYQKDCGLDGIVLSPDFETTGWIYLWYTADVDGYQAYGMYRYTVKNNVLDMNTKKLIYAQEVRYATPWHTGGSMAFDRYGDVWVACGKNANDDPASLNETDKWKSCEYSSSYFKSARGGVIRIHPIPFPDSETPKWGIGSTYTIPRGNLGDYYALKYEKESDPGRAAEFRDTSLVSPEIFAKGARNPWTLAVEPVKRWLAWGENGINRSRSYKTEEHNFTKIPGFFGYPYFAGHPDSAVECPDLPITDCKSSYNISAQMNISRVIDPADPINESVWNDGLVHLPPAIPAMHPYGRNSAMTGPIYRYDGDLVSDVKFPPHFDHLWFLFDFNRGDKASAPGTIQSTGVTKAARLNADQSKIIENLDIFQPPTHNLYGVLEAEMGPDGAMYIINYAGWFGTHQFQNIARFIYTGDCRPAEPRLEENVNPAVYYPPPGYGCMTETDPNFDPMALAHDSLACAGSSGLRKNRTLSSQVGAAFFMNSVYITDAGRHMVRVLDMTGAENAVYKGEGNAHYNLAVLNQPGLHIVRVSTPKGILIRKFAGF